MPESRHNVSVLCDHLLNHRLQVLSGHTLYAENASACFSVRAPLPPRANRAERCSRIRVKRALQPEKKARKSYTLANRCSGPELPETGMGRSGPAIS